MLRMTPQSQVYLALGPTDLRNNIDGLALDEPAAHKEVLKRKRWM